KSTDALRTHHLLEQAGRFVRRRSPRSPRLHGRRPELRRGGGERAGGHRPVDRNRPLARPADPGTAREAGLRLTSDASSPTAAMFGLPKIRLWDEFWRYRLQPDKEAFAEVSRKWPPELLAKLKRVIKLRFGDERITSPSIMEAMQNLGYWPLDE